MDLPGCDAVMGRRPPGERGRPARTTLARPHPSLPPGSTGNRASPLLGSSPCRSRREGGGVRHRRETERHRTGVHAGETPALPGVSFRWWERVFFNIEFELVRNSSQPQKAQKAQNEWLDFESCRSEGSFCVFVPFVAISGKGPSGAFFKPLGGLLKLGPWRQAFMG